MLDLQFGSFIYYRVKLSHFAPPEESQYISGYKRKVCTGHEAKLENEENFTYEGDMKNKLGLSCAKLSTASASYQLAHS